MSFEWSYVCAVERERVLAADTIKILLFSTISISAISIIPYTRFAKTNASLSVTHIVIPFGCVYYFFIRNGTLYMRTRISYNVGQCILQFSSPFLPPHILENPRPRWMASCSTVYATRPERQAGRKGKLEIEPDRVEGATERAGI